MNKEKAKKLIDKYFEAQTNLHEEQQLREYFARAENELPQELKPYAALFNYFSSAAQNGLPENFEQKLLQKVQTTNHKSKRALPTRFWMAAAAAALILLALWAAPPFAERPQSKVTAQGENIDWEKYQPQSEEEALQETIEALQLLAEKLNSSKKKTRKELRKVGKVTRILEN